MARRVLVVCAAAGMVAMLGPPLFVRAAAPCSVPGTHASIQAAIQDSSCDPINVAAGTFTGGLSVNRSVTIQGAGSASTILQGTGGAPVVDIDSSAPYTLNLRALTVTGGGGPLCGGIFVSGAAHTLDLLDVVVTKNVSAGDGAGICALDDSNLRLDRSAVTENEAGGDVGGIRHQTGQLTLVDSHVDRNKAGSNFGGLETGGATVVIQGSTVDGNEAGGAVGGAALSGGTATITDSSFSNNIADEHGGLAMQLDGEVTRVVVDGNRVQQGIAGMNTIGNVTIRDSAITNNTAMGGAAGGLLTSSPGGESVTVINTTISGNSSDDDGGGLLIRDGPFVGTNLTVTNNRADTDGEGGGQGGGINFDVLPGNARLRNTILFGNSDGSPVNQSPDCFGDGASDGSNVIGSLTGCGLPPQGSDKVGVDPLLLPLADNGGNTLTHALLKGSPAIDAADPAFAPPTDQRGAPRNPDIGAYELVRCKRAVVNEIGTDGNDLITGGAEANVVLALGGNDVIKTGGGKDIVCAGPGKDRVNGGGGKDKLFGEGGKDKLKGGGGKDVLNGGPGRDTCNGGPGKDKARACEKERKI